MRYTARTLTALNTNPGCARRGLLDATGIEKSALATQLGFPLAFSQSRFAITRHNALVERLRAADYQELLALTGFTHAQVIELDPTLDIAGQHVLLAPDPVFVRAHNLLHIVLIRSFAVIDGQADSTKVTAAARQAAVYALALRRAGHDLAPNAILICPENFSNRPAAHRMDIRRHIDVLERQLARLTPAAELAAQFGTVTAEDAAVDNTIARIPARYAPECRTACELALYCHDEARRHGSTDMLGRSVRDTLGGVATIDEVLRLAAGEPSSEYPEIGQLLVTARALRAEAEASLAALPPTTGSGA